MSFVPNARVSLAETHSGLGDEPLTSPTIGTSVNLPSPRPAAWAVELRGVARRYDAGDTTIGAVDGVDLIVSAGSFIALAGPSGSGKTTLLNLIAGLDRPTAGTVTVMARSLAGLGEGALTAMRRTTIGLVFQDPHLLPGLTALENVVIGSLPWRKRKDLVMEARALLVELGLERRVDHPPSRLSGGERQRVAIARALVGGRPILLADEPTGNLDSATTVEIVALLGQLREERGVTIVVATHDPGVAGAADRIVHLVDGRLAGDEVPA